MKKSFTLLLLFLTSYLVKAQTILYGTVKNSNGGSIIGATIGLKGTSLGTISDIDGKYKLTLNQNGTVQLSASSVGFKTTQQAINLNGASQEVNFILNEDAFNLDQVVVTGTATGRMQKEMTGSLTQLNAKQIQAAAPNSMADILRFIPGVHAEGGGGEVAANIFIRGLPSGGQYKYTPIEEDGMPVQSTGYLTSSAQDIFFRTDLGVANMEFARGGSAVLFGMGSPAGIFNYISKKGGPVSETTVRLSSGQYSLYRLDFNHGGSINEKTQYNISGFYRYDQGPLVTGLATQGYQLRGNITRQIDNGYIRFYFRALDDNDQFYLPIPLPKNTVKAAYGNDGNQINTLNTPYVGSFGLVTPLATIQGNIGNGVTAKGNSAMFEFFKKLNQGWEFQASTRWSKFEHRFDFFSPAKSYEIANYAKIKVPTAQSYTYTYADNGQPLGMAQSGVNGGKTYVTEENITLRNRPLTDNAVDLRLTKRLLKNNTEHNLTFGTFGSITKQLQDEIGTGILVDFANSPRLVDLSVVGADGKTVKVTNNGFRQSIGSRTYNSFEADRAAIYFSDEMVVNNRLRFDLGVRYDWQHGKINVASTSAYTNPNSTSLADATYRWTTGKNIYRVANAKDYSFVLGTNYKLNEATNLYASFTKGVYFPEVRTFSNVSLDKNGNYVQGIPTKNENLYQLEGGLKYGSSRFSGTAALYYNTIKNRIQNDVVAGSDGILREISQSVGSTSTYGIEVSGAYKIDNHWLINSNVTLQNHKYDEYFKSLPGPDGLFGTSDDTKIDYKGNWVLRQPKFMLNGGLTYASSDWDLGVLLNYTGKRYADDQNLIELPGYTLINMRAGKTIKVGNKETITFGLNLYNAFNNRGLTEGDPRVADTSTVLNDPFYNARPILPRRLTGSITFKF